MRVPGEGTTLEFKEARNQYDFNKLCKYCVALGNEGGGKFILGVSDKIPRQVVGSAAFPNIHKIEQDIFAKLSFRVDVQELEHSNGRVVVFHIPSRPTGGAYNLEGTYFMRVGGQLQPMSIEQLRGILSEGKTDWLFQEAINGCSSKDITRLLNTHAYFDLMKLSYPPTQNAVLESLEHEKLILRQGNRWTVYNLGAILFAKDLKEFPSTSQKAIRLIEYSGISKADPTRLDEFKSKGYAVGFEDLIELVNSLIPRNQIIGTALRNETKMYPEIAVREIIANALVHQDFTETGIFLTVELYADRMEVSNPGKPFIPPDRFIDEYKARNEHLSDLMRRLGICEAKGSGIDKVINAIEKFQLPAPIIRNSELQTQVILIGHKDFQDMDRSDRVRACYQHCCLKYLINQRMNNQSLRERFGLPKDKAATVSQIIAATVDEDRIKLEAGATSSTRFNQYIPFWA